MADKEQCGCAGDGGCHCYEYPKELRCDDTCSFCRTSQNERNHA